MSAGAVEHSGLATLRLNWSQMLQLHAQIDSLAANEANVNRRRGERFAYHRYAQLVVTLHHPGGGSMRFAVLSRDLSAGGAAFLHGTFVYPGTRAVIELETLDGCWIPADAKVVRCRHIAGKAHEVGIAFEQPIDPRQYVAMPPPVEADAAPAMPRLRGCAVCMVSAQDQRAPLRDAIEAVGVKATFVNQPDDALMLIRAGVPADMFIVAAANAIDRLRDGGWDKPLVLLAGDADQPLPPRADANLHPPLSAAAVGDVLLQFLPLADSR